MKAHPEKMFYFRLARELGMTVSQLLKQADSKELAEWMEFTAIEVEQKNLEKKKRDSKLAEEKLRAELTKAGAAAARKKMRRKR